MQNQNRREPAFLLFVCLFVCLLFSLRAVFCHQIMVSGIMIILNRAKVSWMFEGLKFPLSATDYIIEETYTHVYTLGMFSVSRNFYIGPSGSDRTFSPCLPPCSWLLAGYRSWPRISFKNVAEWFQALSLEIGIAVMIGGIFDGTIGEITLLAQLSKSSYRASFRSLLQ